MHNKSAQKKPAKQKQASRVKISEEGLAIVFEANNWEAKKRHSAV